MIMNVW